MSYAFQQLISKFKSTKNFTCSANFTDLDSKLLSSIQRRCRSINPVNVIWVRPETFEWCLCIVTRRSHKGYYDLGYEVNVFYILNPCNVHSRRYLMTHSISMRWEPMFSISPDMDGYFLTKTYTQDYSKHIDKNVLITFGLGNYGDGDAYTLIQKHNSIRDVFSDPMYKRFVSGDLSNIIYNQPLLVGIAEPDLNS